MNKTFIILLLFSILCLKGKGDMNDGYIFHAVYVPDEELINVEIDGVLDDWKWIPNDYYIRADELMFSKNNLKKVPKDVDGYYAVGWNKTTNWVYIVGEIYEDSLELIEDEYKHGIELQFNPSNSSQNIDTNLLTIQLYEKISGESCLINMRNEDNNWMLNKYAEYEISITNDSINKRDVLTFEIGIKLWDVYSHLGENYSIEHVLEEDQTIGLILCVFENDTKLLCTLTGHEAWYWTYPAFMTYFKLDPFSQIKCNVDAVLKFGNNP